MYTRRARSHTYTRMQTRALHAHACHMYVAGTHEHNTRKYTHEHNTYTQDEMHVFNTYMRTHTRVCTCDMCMHNTHVYSTFKCQMCERTLHTSHINEEVARAYNVNICDACVEDDEHIAHTYAYTLRMNMKE